MKLEILKFKNMSGTKSFTEVNEALEKWWNNLQFERKCSGSSTIQKIINNSPPEVQLQVCHVISQEIEKLIEKCFNCNDLEEFQCACNAINGCFNKFAQAVEAVRLLFSKIISFIDLGLAKCQVKLSVGSSQKNAALELLHCLSRILILVLKLKRTQNIRKVRNSVHSTEQELENLNKDDNFKYLLTVLTFKIGQFLMMDDILIDTKSNLSMSAILIKEILIPREKKLVQFHKAFIKSLPMSLSDEEYKLNILKFLTCSAIINTWSDNIIDSNSTYSYLKFFISLCEKYSSEIPVVLIISRTLILLIKCESFKSFVNSGDFESKRQIIPKLLSCIFMLLEHPVACVRHSAKDFLQLLATYPSLHSTMIDSLSNLPTDKKSYFICVGALANEIGSEILIKNNPELPVQIIAALYDPTIVSHVSLALEYIILRDSLCEKNFSKWCETYIMPLLISLQTVLPIVAADIEKLLEKVFKKHPNSIICVIAKWSNPSSCEELRYVVTALKIFQKQGFKLKSSSVSSLFSGNEINKVQNNLGGGKDLISERLLEHCLHQWDDEIRISAFSLIIESQKSTKPYSENDFRLINYFLKYNLNNQQPATRQKILGLIRKMLIKFSESKTNFLKFPKNQIEQEEKLKNCRIYDRFLESLVEFCFSNIFVGCNFNRLNTVLNILLLCFENVKDMCFTKDKTNFYWNKFLIALDSSYEENKELATVLTKKLDLSLLEANNPKCGKLLYDKAFSLCTHMEPPDVLTGSYLLQALLNLPSSKEILSNYFIDDHSCDNVYYNCIQVLMQKLKEQIQLAKLDLMVAATCGPMYGALFAIRLIFRNVDFSATDGQVQEQLVLEKWKKTLNELVEFCFEMTRIVGCVVNSSSTEEHSPMDFQTNFENLCLNFDEKCKVEGLSQGKSVELIQTICSDFFKKFNEVESVIESPNCDIYESLRSLNALLKRNQLLIYKTQVLSNENTGTLDLLYNVKSKLQNHLDRLQKLNTVIDWPATAQVLLLCAWRSIKEASLFFGDLFTKLPLKKEIELGLLTKSMIIRIGEELKTLLCEIQHRGAFEQSYIGFTHLVNSLWKCSDKNLSDLPKQWLEDITNQLESPLSDQKVKLCSTRRSAGLPFLVQAIIYSEVVSLKSTPSSLPTTMNSLLNITENGVPQNPESKIHALNVLSALFKHALLGEHVASYVSKALMVAIRGSRALTWSERNSSSLLFSSLIIRIFGVSRCRDEISKKNRMTSRTFFQRYSELYDFLLSEMELVYSKENYCYGIYPKPSLYLVLLILGRLYPPPTEDPENVDLSEFLPYINMSRRNPVMKIRELGARALVPLISLNRLKDELDNRFFALESKNAIIENERHGILLQIKELLSQSQETLKNASNSEKPEIQWVENTKWLLDNAKQTSLTTLATYIKVLHILYKNFSSLREIIRKLMKKSPVAEELLKLNPEEQNLYLGVSLFLENFYFFLIDILACEWFNSDDCERSEKFVEVFMFTLNCNISEVQSIPLRILNYILKENYLLLNSEDDDLAGIRVPLRDLLFFHSKEKMKFLQQKIITDANILKFLTNHLNSENCKFFKSIVIHRIWLEVVSTLVMNSVVFISHSSVVPEGFLKIDFAKSLVKSKDKYLSTSALICYAIYLMEEVSLKEGEGMPVKDRCVLAEILEEFSRTDADIKERLAVAKILNRCCGSFTAKKMSSDPTILKIWMIPFKLLLDEDASVRLASAEFVHKIQEHLIKEIPEDKLIIKIKTVDLPHLPLVSLKTQECLLDCYINILENGNLQNLIAQMLVMALSSFGDRDGPDSYSKDEFGVFEKGNPNPFCEDLALSNLMCQKLIELGSAMDLKSLMWSDLDRSLSEFIVDSLHLADFMPHNLIEVVESVTTSFKEAEKLKGEFFLPRLQIRNLREALGLQKVV